MYESVAASGRQMRNATYMVSARVVKTRKQAPSFGSVCSRAKSTSTPLEGPIQLCCIVRTFSGHASNEGKASRRSSAKCVMRKNH